MTMMICGCVLDNEMTRTLYTRDLTRNCDIDVGS